MRAIRVRKVEEKAPPTSVQHARKPKKQFSECCCREVFVFVRAVVVRCHATCKKHWKRLHETKHKPAKPLKTNFRILVLGKSALGHTGHLALMRAIRVRKVEEKAPRTSVQHARKPKRQFSECCCREVFVFVRAVVVPCHVACRSIGKGHMKRSTSRPNH